MTSLAFTLHTASLSQVCNTRTDQVTNTERDEVSGKERQREQRKRNTPIDYPLVWFLGWALKWSAVAHSYRRDPLVNRSSPILTKRKTGIKRNSMTGCNNKVDHSTVVRWLSG